MLTMDAVELSYDVYETFDSHADLPPIILIHGMFWNKYMFKELAEKLCSGTKRRVYCLDMRNHGESPVCEDCGMFEMCEDVKRFIKEKDLQKITFVCHSFSTTICYLIALEKPEIVEKLVMVDSFPFNKFFDDINDSIKEVQIQNHALKILNPKMSLRDAREKLEKLAEKETRTRKLFFRKMIHDLQKEDGQFKWKTDIDFLQRKILKEKTFLVYPRGSCEHEILIVRCSNSVNVTDERFEKVRKFNPNTKLVTFEDTTHMLLLEKIEEFVEVVSDFLGVTK
ncbi:hypothetical protein NPIL_374391 [Nephila pilipes]|uniref:sn-1-specific diacylglycerol lipase ABHD11 n=1 Tax=Nephila pilipes TaxID=299642 RepID=A0A8X6TBE5_NEPPI|nr:hypothetical protein NPIL_374392 [Nephila pilipes]GFS92229.1 hypothetical protein NPIL_374391 [Nephila pilipes]